MPTEIPPSGISFLAKPNVWDYLDAIEISSDARLFLSLAFRTRCRMEGNLMDFQFRFSPDMVEGYNFDAIEAWRLLISRELQDKFSGKEVAIMFKISPCCGKDCFGCEQYPKDFRSESL